MLLTVGWSQSAVHGPSSSTALSMKAQARFAAAQQAKRRGDYATAEREYQAVLVEAPEFAEVHMNLGLIYQLQDRTPEAMAEFRRALKIKPTLAGANFFLGVDYCKAGDGRKAIPYLKAAARNEPKTPEIWSWLATALEMSADTHAEVATLKHGLSFQPRDVDMLYLLGHAYERLGKTEVSGLEAGDRHYREEADRAIRALCTVPAERLFHEPQEIAYGALAAAELGLQEQANYLLYEQLRMFYWYSDPSQKTHDIRGMVQAAASILYPAFKENVEALLPWSVADHREMGMTWNRLGVIRGLTRLVAHARLTRE